MLSSLAISLLAMLSAVSAANQPAHCSTTWDDWEHTTAGVKTHECYTYSKTRPAGMIRLHPIFVDTAKDQPTNTIKTRALPNVQRPD